LKKQKKRLIVIVGPTAVGKTAVSLQLAHFFNSPIISADSRQIFREMNIGTAKPTTEELSAAKHYFINTHSISENYDAAQFGSEALQIINDLFADYNTLIVCGGSGLYVKAICEGFDEIPEVSPEIRQNLNANYLSHGLLWLQDKMKELDPAYFELIDQQNPRRLMRALEVKIGTGNSISSFQKKSRLNHNFDIIKIGLEVSRDRLYHRIDMRMDKMIEDGLFMEAEQLYPFKNHNALQTVGYQEIFDFIDGLYDRDETIRLLKRNSRRYAKRQLTWFKRDEEINWFSPDAVEEIKSYLTVDENKLSID
jgi:tRNA dimethylallyltransferase